MQQAGPSKNKNLATYIILGLALLSIAFLGVINPSRDQGVLGAIAAKVGDDEITREEFSRAYKNKLNYYKRIHGEEFKPETIGLANQVLSELVKQRGWFHIARENGSLASIEEITSEIASIPSFYDKDGNFSEKQMQQVLRQAGYTESSLAKQFRIESSSAKLNDQISHLAFTPTELIKLMFLLQETKTELSYVKFDNSKISAEVDKKDLAEYLASDKAKKEIKTYYSRNEADYKSPKEVKARQILVAFKGAERAPEEASKRTKEEALKKAKNLLDSAKKKPSEFGILATKSSDDLYSQNSEGDLGFIEFDEMPEAFSKLVFKSKKGTIIGPIETKFGYHVVHIEDIKEAKDISLEAASEKIATKILEDKKRSHKSLALATELLEKIQKNENTEEFMTKNKLKWEKTPETNLVAQSIPGLPREFVEASLTLQKKGDAFPKVIKKKKLNYVVKLSARKKAELKDMTQERKEELRTSLTQRELREMIGHYDRMITNKFSPSNNSNTYINPQYQSIDAPQ